MELVFPDPVVNATILVVDDDGDSRQALTRFLQKAGHSVISAKDGHDALALLGSAVPDLILLDYRMPDIDGLSLLIIMRSYLRWSNVPVAILTAYPDEPRLLHAQDVGVDRIFVKSDFRFDQLLEYIEQHIRPTGFGQFSQAAAPTQPGLAS